MRILFVGMSESIHTARWLSQIKYEGWKIYLFPSIDYGITNPDLSDVTVFHTFYNKKNNKGNNIKLRGIPVFSTTIANMLKEQLHKIIQNYRVLKLSHLVKQIKPDIIHSFEINAAGYLTLKAKRLYKGNFPCWVVTNWGSDIYLFGRLKEHKKRIKEILEDCDFYSCECHRDVELARKFGFKGEALPVFPNTGGFDIDKVRKLRSKGLTSRRRIILIKGYQGWSGRALVAIRALTRAFDFLKGYKVVIYSAGQDVRISAELFSQETGITVEFIPSGTPHDKMLHHYGMARIFIGLSISDALSTSLLEAAIMGAFPIQSWTSCAGEWVVREGKTALFVHPEDPEEIEKALRRALSDDKLVDEGAAENIRVLEEKLDKRIIEPKTVALYNYVYKNRNKLRAKTE